MRIQLSVLAVLLLAATGTLAGEAEDAFKARVATLPAPSNEAGFEINGRFLLEKKDIGRCVFSARPAEVDGGKVWQLRDQLDLDFAGMKVTVDSRATVSRQLAAIEGYRKETKSSGSMTYRWKRTDVGFEVTAEDSSEKDPQNWVVPHDGDAVATASSLILFARFAMRDKAVYACSGFDPRVGPEGNAIEPTKLTFLGPDEWFGSTAFIVSGSQGKNELTIALDPGRGFMAMRMVSDGGMLAEIVPVEAEEPETSPDPLTAAMANPSTTGMLVIHVQAGSQGEETSVKVGDILVSYDGKPTPTMDAVNAAKAGVAGKETVQAVFVRAEEELVTRLRPGSLGIYLMPVMKGEAVEGLPPATGVRFDFSSLSKEPRDHWYAFLADGTTKTGYQHGTTRIDEDGHLVYRRQVGVEGTARYGAAHLVVTVTATAADRPVILRTRVENVSDGSLVNGRRGAFEDGTAEWRVEWENKTTDESGAVGFVARDDFVSDYLIEGLVPFLPREKGACLHFQPLTEATGRSGPVAALSCAGREVIELEGERAEVWLYEQHRLGPGVTVRYYVDERGRLVLAAYGQARAVIGDKDAVLDGVREELRPRDDK